MRLVRMRDLARQLGIPVRTIQRWVEKDPSLSVLKDDGSQGGPCHWIIIAKLVERGLKVSDAYTIMEQRWVKAVDLAAVSGISRKTVANWCRGRPGFAKRLGRVWYVDLEQFGASPEEAAILLEKINQRHLS